ncbi:MAG: glycosyltransferase [Acidobacteriota bacterium]|nr:glycosyltransferase [Acidobacteriota bacterium]MDH3528562.1 glycosyltransferase [Acidobacteriota bacterium]
MPDVFVLVPSYNHARFVERALRSIFGQSLRPNKLLVIDDGSTDGSVEIIERTLDDCPFASELIVRENRGLSKTLNQGFSISNGEYFAYLGSDDLWLPSFLKEGVSELATHPEACLVFGNAYLLDQDDFVIDETGNWHDFNTGNALPFLLEGKIFSSPGVIYRAAYLPEKPWDEDSRLEDYDLYLRLAAKHEFVFNKQTLCGWRQHDYNASGNLPEMFPEFMKAHENALERLKIAEPERERLRNKINFEAAFNFVRHGFKKEGMRYMIRNLRGAESVAGVLDIVFRLLVPKRLFQWNRRRKYELARRKFGKLDLSGRGL